MISTLRIKNTVFGFLPILIWSFGALLAVELTSIPPFQILFFEFSIAFAVVVFRYLISKESTFFNFKKRDLLVVSLFLISNQVCYYSAFRYSPSAQVDLINYLWPTFLILFSSFLPNEKFCPSYLIACLFCLMGLYLLIPNAADAFSAEHRFGYFLAFGSAMSWTLYCLYSRYNANYSANCISWACGIAALFSLGVHLRYETYVTPSLFEMLLITLVGVFQIGLAYYFWEIALKKGSVKILGLAAYTIPLFSVMILVLFGEAEFEYEMAIATILITCAPIVPGVIAPWFKQLSKSRKMAFVRSLFLL